MIPEKAVTAALAVPGVTVAPDVMRRVLLAALPHLMDPLRAELAGQAGRIAVRGVREGDLRLLGVGRGLVISSMRIRDYTREDAD